MLFDQIERMTSSQEFDANLSASEIETLQFLSFMDSPRGWGREQGRIVYGKLLDDVESKPGTLIFRVSMKGVQRLDISFASETLVELAWRFRGKKGFALCDLEDADMVENWDAAAARKSQPLTIWNGRAPKLVGLQPSQGNIEAFRFALKSPSVRAAQFAAEAKISIGNASMKFKQLWEQGFLLRRETVADSGGVEFEYLRIG